MIKKFASFTIFCALLGITTPPVCAETKSLGTYGKWSAYVFTEPSSEKTGKKNKVCFITSDPIKKEPKKKDGREIKRGDVRIHITNRPAESVKHEVSFIVGYTFKKDKEGQFRTASAQVSSARKGKEDFVLLTKNEGAWMESAKHDHKAVQSMKSGKEMLVKGTSARGTDTKDTYSLSGFTRALQSIDKECR